MGNLWYFSQVWKICQERMHGQKIPPWKGGRESLLLREFNMNSTPQTGPQINEIVFFAIICKRLSAHRSFKETKRHVLMYIFLPFVFYWIKKKKKAINCQNKDRNVWATWKYLIPEPSISLCNKCKFIHRHLPSAKAEKELYHHEAPYNLCSHPFSMAAFPPICLDCIIKGIYACV